MDKATRIGIFDYSGFFTIGLSLGRELGRNGYNNVKYIDLVLEIEGKPISQILDENSHEFDVFLIHPGSKGQKEAEKFIETHREKRAALIVLGMEDYEKKDGLLILPYDIDRCDGVIDFIEGRLEIKQKPEPEPPADF